MRREEGKGKKLITVKDCGNVLKNNRLGEREKEWKKMNIDRDKL